MQKVQDYKIFLKRVHDDKTYLRTTKDMQDQEKISVNKFIFRRMAKRHKPGRKWPDNAIQEENWKRWQVSIIIISKLENEENEHKNI